MRSMVPATRGGAVDSTLPLLTGIAFGLRSPERPSGSGSSRRPSGERGHLPATGTAPRTGQGRRCRRWEPARRSCGTTPGWQPGQAEIAAAGGAGRRHAKNAARPLNQSREAHPLGLAAPLPPRGAMRGRGWAPGGYSWQSRTSRA